MGLRKGEFPLRTYILSAAQRLHKEGAEEYTLADLTKELRKDIPSAKEHSTWCACDRELMRNGYMSSKKVPVRTKTRRIHTNFYFLTEKGRNTSPEDLVEAPEFDKRKSPGYQPSPRKRPVKKPKESGKVTFTPVLGTDGIPQTPTTGDIDATTFGELFYDYVSCLKEKIRKLSTMISDVQADRKKEYEKYRLDMKMKDSEIGELKRQVENLRATFRNFKDTKGKTFSMSEMASLTRKGR